MCAKEHTRAPLGSRAVFKHSERVTDVCDDTLVRYDLLFFCFRTKLLLKKKKNDARIRGLLGEGNRTQ